MTEQDVWEMAQYLGLNPREPLYWPISLIKRLIRVRWRSEREFMLMLGKVLS